jgi:hypothetical protein
LDAETGGLKSALEIADVRRDGKSGDDTGEIPAETASLESPTKCAVWEDWMVEAVGHKLATHQPVIEPVSAAEPGTEIFDAETGAQKPTYHWQRLIQRREGNAKSPHSGAINANRLTEV